MTADLTFRWLYGRYRFVAVVGFFPEAPLIFARLAAIEDLDVDRQVQFILLDRQKVGSEKVARS